MTLLQRTPQGLRLSVWVQPRAARSVIAGVHGEALKVRLAALPVNGAANRELVRFLAEVLGVSRSDVRLVAGASTRSKVVELTGIEEAQARARLGLDR